MAINKEKRRTKRDAKRRGGNEIAIAVLLNTKEINTEMYHSLG